MILHNHTWTSDTLQNDFCAVCGLPKHHHIHTMPIGSANDRQVGGDHYKTSGPQHWDMVVEFDLDYFQGQITKYLFRWRRKNGLEDLEKAKHYLEKYIELAKASDRPAVPPVGFTVEEAPDSNVWGDR